MRTIIINGKNPLIKKYFPLLIIINISIKICQTNYIYFPLKPKDNRFLKSLKNINHIMKFIYLEPLISEIIIGEPEQKIIFFFRTDCTYAYLTSQNHKISKGDITFDFIKEKFGDISYYNPEVSNSFNIYNKIKNYSYPYDNQYTTKLIGEKFKLNGKYYYSNMTLAEFIEFEEPGAFCLQIREDDNKGLDFTPSFPVILKKNLNIINNYIWFIYYSQDNKNDYLVLGASPNEFKDPKNGNFIYKDFDKDKNYFNINDEWDISRAAMRINFNEIYLIEDDKKTKIIFGEEKNFKGRLMPNIGFIVGTLNYSDYIEKNLFGEYIQNGKCHKDIFTQRPDLSGEEYTYFYCEKALYSTMQSSFKTIIFKQTNFLENFELTFNDLFTIQNRYLIFLVIFSTHQHYHWDLGKPFIKKYQFEFDFENKKIGYYKLQNSVNDKNKENNKKNDKTVKNIFISIGAIILSAMLIILGINIGKNYFKLRKKRANELDDDFDYQENKEVSPIINE